MGNKVRVIDSGITYAIHCQSCDYFNYLTPISGSISLGKAKAYARKHKCNSLSNRYENILDINNYAQE